MQGDSPAAPEILSRSPEEGARRLALGYLDQAGAVLPRLAGREGSAGEDPEALHDMRVALRRLRSCLRAYRTELDDSPSRGAARRLRRLARATGPGRDTEVQMAWLRQQAAALARHHRAGLSWLLARLEARLEAAYGELRGELAEGFPPLASQLREELSVYRAEVHLDGGRPPSFGGAAADLLAAHAADLERRLARIDGAGEEEKAHRARISAKQLRYLAEPLALLLEPAPGAPAAPALPGAPGAQGDGASTAATAADAGVSGAPEAGLAMAVSEAAPARRQRQARADTLVQRLKELQDLLGELHDAHVLEAELAAALAEAATERAGRLLDLALQAGGPDPGRLRQLRRRPQEPGLLALARLNRERRDRLFADFAARWQGGAAKRLARDSEQLGAALRAAGGRLSGGA